MMLYNIQIYLFLDSSIHILFKYKFLFLIVDPHLGLVLHIYSHFIYFGVFSRHFKDHLEEDIGSGREPASK